MRFLLFVLLLAVPCIVQGQEAPDRKPVTPPPATDCGCGSGTQAGGPR